MRRMSKSSFESLKDRVGQWNMHNVDKILSKHLDADDKDYFLKHINGIKDIVKNSKNLDDLAKKAYATGWPQW